MPVRLDLLNEHDPAALAINPGLGADVDHDVGDVVVVGAGEALFAFRIKKIPQMCFSAFALSKTPK